MRFTDVITFSIKLIIPLESIHTANRRMEYPRLLLIRSTKTFSQIFITETEIKLIHCIMETLVIHHAFRVKILKIKTLN